jgi:thiol-disulfide isomerase/thioredoxin
MGGGVARFPQDFQAKVVFLNFWASWCPECKIELPELAKIQDKYKGEPFVLIAVNIDKKRETADKFLKKLGLDLFVLYDTEQVLIKSFEPVGIPASYLIGPDGKVEKFYLGFDKYYIEKYTTDIEDQLKKIRSASSTGQEKAGARVP